MEWQDIISNQDMLKCMFAVAYYLCIYLFAFSWYDSKVFDHSCVYLHKYCMIANVFMNLHNYAFLI